MRLASINVNKRLGNPAARARITTWLQRHQVDVLAAQEPWKPVARPPIDLPGYRRVGGDGDLFCWIAEQFAAPPVSRPVRFVQRIELAWLAVCNTYLDCRSTTARAGQLHELRQIITAGAGRPTLVCGDFNLAPRPIDGLHNGQPSRFNTGTDRKPLSDLLAEAGLVDTTATEPPEFTIERHRKGSRDQFRCDLTLVPDHLLAMVTVRHDHGTRVGETAFTDHSGLLIDVPVTLDLAADGDQETLFAVMPHADRQATLVRPTPQAHKTAMGRARPSPFARSVVAGLVPGLGIGNVLDHGCGRGGDLAYYREAGIDADGWDPHPGFGRTTLPARRYDLVTSIFVLNVLPDPWQRIRALQHAAGFVRPGGWLLVVTRSPADIQARAAAGGWPAFHDGYWSHQAKATFQKGISTDEIVAMARHAGLQPAAGQALSYGSPVCGQVLLRKPA